MREPSAFEYVVVRVVPRVEREEFVNAGVIVYCPAQRLLRCHIQLDEGRLHALSPETDVHEIEQHLQALRAVCDGQPDAGPIASLPVGERFHWLSASRSTVVQTSPVHTGLGDDASAAAERLFESLVT